MAISPAGHRILVQPIRVEEVDKALASAKRAGIYIDESALKKEQSAIDRGVVIKIGNSAFKDFGTENWCQIGDTVAYARYAGKAITDPENDTEYVVLNDEDICAIIS